MEMITEKQAKYIDYLCSIKDTSNVDDEFEHFVFSYYKTTKIEASMMIRALLKCENKSEEEIELEKIRSNIYEIVHRKRTKKGQKLYQEIKNRLNKYITKFDAWTLTKEEAEKVKDLIY